MPRIRSIKPDFYDDERLGELPVPVRFLFIGLWVFADDDGVVKANPKWLKSKIYPFDDDMRIGTLEQQLLALSKSRMLIPFTYNGENYYVIRNFKKHQKIDRPYPSLIPQAVIEETLRTFDEHSPNTRRTFDEHSPNTRRTFDEHSPLDKDMDKERERENEAHACTHAKPPDESPHKTTEPKDVPKCYDDVAAYFAERKGNPVEAEKFYNHYSANGWRVGKNPMKDWKAAVRNWLLNTNNYGASNANNSTTRGGSAPARGGGTIADLAAVSQRWGLPATVTTEPLNGQSGH